MILSTKALRMERVDVGPPFRFSRGAGILDDPRLCWPPEHDLLGRRDHFADGAAANSDENRDAYRHQSELNGRRWDRPVHVSRLGNNRNGSNNGDMILKRNISLAACEDAQILAI